MNNQREVESIYTISNNERILIPVRTKAPLVKRIGRCVCMTVVIFTIIVATGSITGILFKKFSGVNNDEDNLTVCETEECMRTASSLKEIMDTSVDPCEDFSRFVCGKWGETHFRKELGSKSWFMERQERVKIRVRDLLQKPLTVTTDVPQSIPNAKALYNSCMNKGALNNQKLQPLLSLLKRLELPQIPAAFTHKPTQFIKQIALTRRILNMDVFFGIGVLPNYFNNTNNIICIGSPFNSSPFPSLKELRKRIHGLRQKLKKHNSKRVENEEDEEDKYYTDDIDVDDENYDDNEYDKQNMAETFDEEIEPHLTLIKYVITEIFSNGTVQQPKCPSEPLPSFPYKDDIDDVGKDIYKLWKILQQLQVGAFADADDEDDDGVDDGVDDDDDDNDDEDDDDLDASFITIDALQKTTDKYVKKTVKKYKPRKIWKPFFEELFRDIIDSKVLSEIQLLAFDLKYLKYIALVFATISDEMLETYTWWTVVETVAPHSSYRLREVYKNYTDTVLGVYPEKMASLKCSDVVEDYMPMAIAWLYADSEFHQDKGIRVSEMLRHIKSSFSEMVIQANWMDQATKINTLRKNSKMKSVIGYPVWTFDKELLDNYYKNITLSNSYYLDNMIQLIHKASMDELKLISVNNDRTQAEALNYGGLGAILGHELTHGFDNNGRKFDSDGNYRQWWTNDTISKYVKKSKCFVKHYNSYYIEEANSFVNGKKTLGENIADNGGLKEAINAYRLWKEENGEEPLLPGFTNYTHEQLLFISFANLWCGQYSDQFLAFTVHNDPHAPAEVRIQAVLKNSVEFSEAWNCPLGSAMNPIDKCNLW